MKQIIAMLISLILAAPIGAKDWSDEQLEVWGRLQQCWTLFETGPAAEFADCYHSKYLGWYSGDPLPMPALPAVRDFYQKSTPRILHFLQPREIIVHGDSAVVHYSAFVAVESGGETVSAWENWTDMLVRDENVWRILGDHNHTARTD